MNEQIDIAPEPTLSAQPLTPEKRLAAGQAEISSICQKYNLDIIANLQFAPDGNGGWRPLSPVPVQIVAKG